MSEEVDQLSFQTKDWSAIPRIARTVPFGYRVDDNDPDLLQPIIFELEALALAKKHLKKYSYREVAEWLTATTGRYISHMGLKKRLDNERRRKRAATVLAEWTKTIERRKRKAEALLTQRVGAGKEINSSENSEET